MPFRRHKGQSMPKLTLPPPSQQAKAHKAHPARWLALIKACPGHAALYLALALLLLSFAGCSILNRYLFIPKLEIYATPEKYQMPYQELWFAARDGVQLNAWYLPGAPDKPLILFFHGNAGNLSDNLEYLHLLHGSGFPVFIFDYRGFGKSDGEPLQEDDLYQDARGALAYLSGQGWRPERMVFFGQSLGSAVALQMALETRPAGLVLESSFTSMKEIVKHASALAYYTVGWWSINLHFDNLAKIGRAEVPLLLIHGDQDLIVPVQMTRQLFERAGSPKMLHIISGGGHCDVFTHDSSAYLAAWSGYLESLQARAALP